MMGQGDGESGKENRAEELWGRGSRIYSVWSVSPRCYRGKKIQEEVCERGLL